MKRNGMILSVMALVFAFSVATVSAQNAPKAKTSTQKVVTEKSDKDAPAVGTKGGKACTGEKKSCATPCSADKAKSCATPCSGDKAKSSESTPVPASDKK